MKTPICDFVEKYANENTLRLHMPGHKGQGVAERVDITEIGGADVLYQSEGIIAESQQNAANLFGAAKTLYSCEGSSLSIRAMVYLALLQARKEGKEPKILAGRNAHKTFVSATALMDIEVAWIYGESLLSCNVTPERLLLAIKEHSPSAVFITSPDYLGRRADIKGLSAVCKECGVLLMVDNAHGAYLHFLPKSEHPLALGADMCCDSAHKTLPVLTGGGYLHVSRSAPRELCEQAESAMSLFASTSPSYLILQSLDRANDYLTGGYAERLNGFAKQMETLRQELAASGLQTVGDEPLKLTLSPKSYGYEGAELSLLLRQKGIVSEFADPDHIVFMFTPEQSAGLQILCDALKSLPRRAANKTVAPKIEMAERVVSPHLALFSPTQTLPVDACEGRVLGAPSVSCPPAVAVRVCGERIDRNAIDVMKYYGITECKVIK